MRSLPYGMWRYALLLLFLLVLSALASLSTIFYLNAEPGLQLGDAALRVVNLKMFGLALGSLFLCGAFGIWAIRSSLEAESRRRLGRLIDAMNFLSDGVVAVDRSGRITAFNAPARALGQAGVGELAQLQRLYACLNAEDLALLLDGARPQEVERTEVREGRRRILRFRSEPLDDVNIVLISDVTEQRSRDVQDRQAAQLQLIGRIARGVAHDFNNILCAIGGYASLLRRRPSPSDEDAKAIEEVAKQSERGAALARQLLDLGRSGVRGRPVQRIEEEIRRSADFLRVALPPRWKVEVRIKDGLPAIPLTPAQLEQTVLNLGLMVADEYPEAGAVWVEAGAPGQEYARVEAGAGYAARIDIHANPAAVAGSPGEAIVQMDFAKAGEPGVILSVLRSMVEEVGGRMETYVTDQKKRLFRLLLPAAERATADPGETAGIPEEMRPYLSQWTVLLACPPDPARFEIQRRLTLLGVRVESADNLVSALALVNSGRGFHAIVFEQQLLGSEAEGLLRAILKIQSAAGLVLLNETPESVPESLRQSVVFQSSLAGPDEVVRSMIQSREQAGQRRWAA